jgi:uncharacterized OB-fold protein
VTLAPNFVAEGLFEIVDGDVLLLGSRCTACSSVYFPEALSCRNPECQTKSVQRTHLAAAGTLLSYTVQRYRPPPLFRMDDWSPYAIGLVQLGDDLQVMGMLQGIPIDDIRIGAELKVVAAPLFSGPEGIETLTYKFAPRADT